MDDLVAKLERERLGGMPRWKMTTLRPDHVPVDHSIVPNVPVDIHAADHRRDIADEPVIWRTA